MLLAKNVIVEAGVRPRRHWSLFFDGGAGLGFGDFGDSLVRILSLFFFHLLFFFPGLALFFLFFLVLTLFLSVFSFSAFGGIVLGVFASIFTS